jgi:hypothetical protein
MLPLLIQLREFGHPVPIMRSMSTTLLTPPAKSWAITGGTNAAVRWQKPYPVPLGVCVH